MGVDPLAATLTWLDHDTTDRDRMNRILALFRERDTRDELGIGVIRSPAGLDKLPLFCRRTARLCWVLAEKSGTKKGTKPCPNMPKRDHLPVPFWDYAVDFIMPKAGFELCLLTDSTEVICFTGSLKAPNSRIAEKLGTQ